MRSVKSFIKMKGYRVHLFDNEIVFRIKKFDVVTERVSSIETTIYWKAYDIIKR